jgi:hypothetical protein
MAQVMLGMPILLSTRTPGQVESGQLLQAASYVSETALVGMGSWEH